MLLISDGAVKKLRKFSDNRKADFIGINNSHIIHNCFLKTTKWFLAWYLCQGGLSKSGHQSVLLRFRDRSCWRRSCFILTICHSVANVLLNRNNKMYRFHFNVNIFVIVFSRALRVYTTSILTYACIISNNHWVSVYVTVPRIGW